MNNEIINSALRTFEIEALALENLKEQLGLDFERSVCEIKDCSGKTIVIGMGKSGLVGRKIAATLASTGTPSFFLHPGEAFHGDLGMISSNDIILALSYSGETDEILKIVPFIKENGNKLITMTGNPNSSLAKNADYHLNVSVKEEACILHLAPTASTTAQMAMGDALSVALMKIRDFKSIDFARFHPGGSLGKRLLLRVENVMRKDDLPIVSPMCQMKDLVHTLSEGRLGLVVVCKCNEVLGIITDGDLRRAMESNQNDFFSIHAEDLMTLNPKTVLSTDKLIEAEKMMTRYKINSLLVTNSAQALKGVIQIYDLKI